MVIASVPNVAHWYPRLRAVTGRFDYDARGILDATHLRFFTDRTFRRLAREAGYDVRRREAVGLPFDALAAPGRGGSRVSRTVRLADRVSVNLYPSLFAYQFVYELTSGQANGSTTNAGIGSPLTRPSRTTVAASNASLMVTSMSR
jgi:hypothetical protein